MTTEMPRINDIVTWQPHPKFTARRTGHVMDIHGPLCLIRNHGPGGETDIVLYLHLTIDYAAREQATS